MNETNASQSRGLRVESLRAFVVALAVTALLATATAVQAAEPPASDARYLPELASLTGFPESELRNVVERYTNDHEALLRRFDAAGSPTRRVAMRAFYEEWHAGLQAMDFAALGVEGRIDLLLLENRVTYELARLRHEERIHAETAPLLPFAEAILDLHEARRRLESVDPQAAATTLHSLKEVIEETQRALERGLEPPGEEPAGEERIETTRILAHRAAGMTEDLRATLAGWFGFFDGYDPLFSWWTKNPYEAADAALGNYLDSMRQRIVGEEEGKAPPVVGDPAGRQALLEDLGLEMIPYTPEELIALGRQELAWCEAELAEAAREMGYDDWKAALEHVKTLHVAPGRQGELVRDLARETVRFLEERDLVSIPPLAQAIWRMEMLTPEQQKLNPFFSGGEVVGVAFPSDTMTHEQKRMSLRGNNVHFSRAVVHHELIPGHHLQFFMADRYNAHRWTFTTPFYMEGWALYWEMLLWDLGFPQSPENKIGMLFWRLHRAARILFSLGFHLGEMTPQEAIDFLVERAGHERENATAEVRRSFAGLFPPLYQLAYMVGGLQFRALREELVESGKMSDREFHDAILRGGTMPVEMVRARLLGLKLGREHRAAWKFAGEE